MPNRPSFILLLFVISWLQTSLYACDMTVRAVEVVKDDFESRFAHKVFNRIDCKLEQKVYPQALTLERRMEMLRKGQIDVIIGMNKRPDREEYANFSIPFLEERIRLWARKGEEHNYQGLDLNTLVEQGIKILGPDAGWYGPDYQALVDNDAPQLTLFKDFKHGLTLLHKGRNDLILGSENFSQYIQPHFQDITVMLPQVIHTDYLRFMYSKKTVSPEVIKIIDQAITAELQEQAKQ